MEYQQIITEVAPSVYIIDALESGLNPDETENYELTDEDLDQVAGGLTRVWMGSHPQIQASIDLPGPNQQPRGILL